MSKAEQLKCYVSILRCMVAKPNWWRSFKEALSHDGWDEQQLAEYNWKRRLAILKFAYENSPYYYNLYKNAGLEPGDIKNETDWCKVPMLAREALRFNFDEIKIRNLKPGTYALYTTGGSTGEPSKVLKDNGFSSRGMIWRSGVWAGKQFGQNSAVIMRTHPTDWKGRVRNFLASWPAKKIMLDAGDMSEQNIRQFIEEWRRYKPQSVSSYVGGVHELAIYCLQHGIELPPPKVISTTAAPLEDIVRQTISRAFHAPVYDNYVATEAHPMANQCSCQVDAGERSLHIHSDYRHLEFVDDVGRPMPVGEVGDILVTDLGDKVFPIVRYRLGDRGRALPGKCRCGRPYPLMDAVHGRSFDFIYLKDRRIMGECWATAFDDCLYAIHNFQIHQFADKSVELSVVINDKYPEAKACVQGVAKSLQAQLGDIPLKVVYKDFIPHNRGKIKYIISDIKE